MPIRYFDMFAGIGGFRSGLETVGGFECVGYCEIDPYARKAYEALYDTRGEKFYEDATKIIPEQLPDFDLICGGFPCQSFSIAGARRGFEDMRGTLFFEIARIAAVKRPKYLYLENVPGLLSHDKGGTNKGRNFCEPCLLRRTVAAVSRYDFILVCCILQRANDQRRHNLCHLPGVGVALLTVNRNVATVAAVRLDKFCALHKHTAASAAGIYKRPKNDTTERNPCFGCIWVHF